MQGNADRAAPVACMYCERLIHRSPTSSSGWRHSDVGDVFCAMSEVPADAKASPQHNDGDE